MLYAADSRVPSGTAQVTDGTAPGTPAAPAASSSSAGLGQALITLAKIPTEDRGSAYLIRLVAFALIIFAIARKNRRGASN